VDWCKDFWKIYTHGVSKNDYKIVKADESLIPPYEPKTKQQSIVWVFEDKPNPTKGGRDRSTSSQMVGHLATVPLEQRRTADSEWYTIIRLSEDFG